MSSTNNDNNTNPDAKLTHLVRKFLSFSVDSSPNADHIVHCLRAQHREYQRKDLAKLKRQVHKVLKSITANNERLDGSVTNTDHNNKNHYGSKTAGANGNDNKGPTLSASKLKEIQEEDDYDRSAREHDEQRIRQQQAATSSLNASILESYRRLQQNRAAEEAAQAASAVQHSSGAGVPADIDVMETTATPSSGPTGLTSGSKKRSLGDVIDSKNGSGGNNTSMQTSGSEVKNTGNEMMKSMDPSYRGPSGKTSSSSKRKKSLSKRHSSLSSNDYGALDAYRGGESNRGDGITASEAVPRPTERYSDLGGMEEVLTQIRQLVEYPLVRPELYRHLGVDPPRGVLLRGPPG